MRKSFTRLFGVFMLLSLFCISAVLGANPVFEGANSIPKVDANNVKPTDVTSFVVVFDQAITLTASGGTFSIYSGTGLLLKTITIPSASVQLGADGKSLVVNPGMTLTSGKYSLSLTAGSVKSADGGLNAAIAVNTWRFVMGDYVAPKLKAGSNFSPKDDASHVAATSATNFTLVFDEPVVAGSGNVVLYRADGVVVDMKPASAGTYVGANATFTFAPTDGFKDMTGYYVKVDAGAIVDHNNELDVSGAATGVYNHNKFAGVSDNTTYNFSTKDYSAPVIVEKSVSPAGTSATLSVSLNEVGKVKYIVQLASLAAPSAATVLASTNIVDVTAANTIFTANMGGLTTDKNYKVYLATTVTYSSADPSYTVDGTAVSDVAFKTSDGSAPSITSALDNTARINNDDKKTVGVKIHYNEEVVAGSGTITVRRSSDDFGYLNIPASSVTVKKITDTDYEVSVPFLTALESDVLYYVVIPQGVIKDKQNNPSPEVTQLSGFYINGYDFTVPQVESVKFSSDPTTLADNIVITFSENLISSSIVGGVITDNNLAIAFESNNVDMPATIAYAPFGAKSTITIDPASLNPNTTYSVRVRPGVFKDDNGNTINTELTYTLTTRDLGTAASAYSVGDMVGSKIAKNAKFTITFDKLPRVVDGSTTVAATVANLSALVTLQKVASPNVNLPFVLAFGMNSTSGKYEAVITPSTNLESDITVKFDMDESKLKDSQGTVFGGVSIADQTVEDWKSPTVDMKRKGNIYPAYPAFAIEFNEVMSLNGTPIADGTSLVNLLTVKNGDANGTNIALTSVIYTTADKTITIVPASAFEFGKTYYYAIGSSLTDAAGNKIPATSASFTYNDTQVVKATATSPSKGATGVVLTGSTPTELAVSVTFDQVVGLIVSKTPAERTAYLLPVGSTTIVPGTTPEHVIVDTDVVNSTLSFKFTGLAEATFNALPTGSKWYVYIPAGIIRSSSQATLLFAGFPLTTADGTGDVWPANYFVAKDVAKPIASYTIPGAAIALDANLAYTFNEEVVKGSGNILIKAGGTEQTIDVNSGSVELAGNGLSVVIKHSALTKYGTAYTVEVPVSAFKDKAGNELAGAVTGNFTTVTNPAPTATFTPADGADVVASGANLVVKFSEPVIKVTGKLITLYKWDAALTTPAWVLIENILAENTSVSAEVVTINPTADFLPNTDYAVQIQVGAYKDLSLPASADFGGFSDYTTWNFTTKNNLAPTATFIYVKRSDEKVENASNIVIKFNKPIEKADGSAILNTDIPSLFSLKQTVQAPGGTLILPIALTFTGIISDDKTTVTLNGASYTPVFVSQAGYTVSTVALAMRGTSNNVAIGTISELFTISDYTKPVAVIPTFAGVTDSKMKVTMQSNEDGKLYYIFQAGDAATATPSAATIMAGISADATAAGNVEKEFTGLTSQGSYVIFVVAVDKMGNVSDVVKAVQATQDVNAPSVTAKTSVFDKTAKTLELTFNEAVSVSGNAVLFDKATMVKVVDLPLSIVGGSDNKKVSLLFAGMALDVKEYYVEIENSNIKDLSNNNFAGIYGTSWLVSSADQTAPGAPTVKPTDATGIKLNEVFTVEFNEDVKLVDPMPVSAVVIAEGANPFEVVANVTASGKIVTIDPGRDFREVTSYTLTVLANAFSDLAGNKYNAPITKTFTTLDATPASVAWSPDGSATVPASTTTALTITFDQAISQVNGTTIEVYDLDSLVTLTTTAAAVPAHTKSLDGTGKIITISIPGGLKSGTAYTYGFKAKFKGTDGLTIPAQSKTFQTKQSSESITILPADNDADNTNRIPVPVNQTFSISANLPFFTWSGVAIENNLSVTADYAKSAVKLYPGGTTTGAIDMDAVVSADGRTISLTPKANLNSTSNYDLVVLANKLQLGTGNSSALNTGDLTMMYTTIDVRKPILDATADAAPFTDGYAPAKGGIVGKSEALKLAFDENVKAGAGMIEIHRQDGVLVKSVDASAITTDNKVATILSSLSDLPVNQIYYVIVPAGALTDNSGNVFDGLTGITSWSFTVKDDVSPQATYTPNNVSGVMLNTDLKLTFDRAVTSNPNSTAPTSWIAVYKADGTAVELIKPPYGSKVTYSAGSTVATIDINNLEQNTTYNVEVGPGAFMSTTNVPFAGILRSAWSFTTEDNTAPKAVEFTPANKGTIDLWDNTLSIKFDKNIAKGTGKIYVRKAPGLGELLQEFDVNSADVKIVDDVLSFAVTGLMANTNYYVIIENTAITNTSTTPESFAGLLTPDAWTFSTNTDAILPTAEYAPNGAEAIDLVPADVVLTMTFTEPVVAGLGNLVIYNAADNAVVETIAIVPAMVADMVVTVTPTKLVEGKSYYVLVDAGVVKDLAANNFIGVTNKADWTFVTGDFTAPKPISWDPKGQIADNHPIFKVTYDSPVQFGTAGNLKVYKVGSTTPWMTIPVTASMVSGSVVTVTYIATATMALDQHTAYYVLVDAGVVKDMGGNAATGITDPTAWTFTTGDFKVGVEPNFSLEFKVYPNPFVDYVNVANASLLSKIVVTNIAGQTVKQVVNPTERIQLNELRSGVYFMSMYDMDNVVKGTAKIVKR